MKKGILHAVVAACLSVGFCGCGDFLEEKSQNMAYVENVTDLDELLIGEGYWPVNGGNYELDLDQSGTPMYWSPIMTNMEIYFPYIHLMDDDVTEYLYYSGTGGGIGVAERNYPRLKAAHLHHWQPEPFLDDNNEEIDDQNWSATWRRIAVMNSILFQMQELRDGEEDQALCDRVEGEAHFLRAQYYFWLANLYGRPYTKATASTDLCIPLKTTEDVEDRYFSRSTAEEVYGQMVEDLEQATELLRGIEQESKYRANQTAAFVLLSRVHLFMENYEAAIACADSALANSDYDLLDLNTWTGESAVYENSPEVIFSHSQNIMAVLHASVYSVGANSYTSTYTSSSDLMDCFDANDLRREAFFVPREAPGDGYRCVKCHYYEDGSISDMFAIRLPEAYLNKAEALALLGREAEAIETVQALRANRFAPEHLGSVSESGDALINFIRDERRRELCFEGFRWFDLRRYAVNSVCPFEKEIRHVSMAYTQGAGVYAQGTYVLGPYSQDGAAYVLPIPSYAIEFNEGNLTNEVRPAREMIVE